MRDAAAEASIVQRERDADFARAELSFMKSNSARPTSLAPVSPPSHMDHVEQHPQPSSPIASDAFMFPGEPRETKGEGSLDPPPSLSENLFEDSPQPARTSRVLCANYQRGMCIRGSECPELHSNVDRFTTVSYGTDSSTLKRDCRRNLSWDDKVTYHSVPSTPNISNKQVSSPRQHVDNSQSNEPLGSSCLQNKIVNADTTAYCGGDAGPILGLSDLQIEIEKLNTDLNAS